MKKVVKVISYTLSFLLMVCIIAFIALNIIKAKFLKEEYVLDVLNKVNYYEHVSKSIENEFENYYMQSGLEHYVIENLFDDNKVKEDSINVIHSIYNNMEIDVETDSIKERLQNNIEEMLEKENKRIDSSNQKNVDKLINIIANTYESQITIHKKGLAYVGKIMNKVDNMTNKINKVILATIIVLSIVIIVINVKKLNSTFNFLGISAFSSGFICVIFEFVIKKVIKIQNLFTLSESLSLVVRYVATDILSNIRNIGIVLMIIGFIFIVIHAVNQRKE